MGLVTRSDLVSPRPRRVLVDHAEQAQSVPGVEQAEIVEILDHHHIGSIETRVPVSATFDPVGSTATLVVERFRQNGMEPSRTAAGMLLAAVLSDTVLLNSPTTTDRDRVVVDFLERALGVNAMAFGAEMFEVVSMSPARRRRHRAPRRARRPAPGCESIVIAQIEVRPCSSRSAAFRGSGADARRPRPLSSAALMVMDMLSKGTDLLLCGDVSLG